MMRSMFSGVSGLRAHQTRMDVIGNNVANVNTVGFKSGRVTFSEIFSQTLRGAGAPDSATGRGGTNPMQVGLGLNINAIDTLMTRGSLQRTDNPTDVSIEGEGFFVVKGGEADAYKFTRAGNFSIDKLGNLVTGSGLNVYGWQELAENRTDAFNTDQDATPINLYNAGNRNMQILPAKETSYAVLSGNLDASKAKISTPPAATDYVFKMPMTVYDRLGNSYKITVEFTKTDASATGSEWTYTVDTGTGTPTTDTLTFDVDGKLTDPLTKISIPFQPDATAGTGGFDVDFDFTKITTFAADSSVKPTDVDGYTMGSLVTFNVGSDGIITGVYDNGQQQALGQFCIATFQNAAGLQKVGDNLYIQTTNSGDFNRRGVKPGASGAGTLSPGTLEMSNVDLSREFTDMIITQRGFQANSRIITTSDEMLQELVNMKR